MAVSKRPSKRAAQTKPARAAQVYRANERAATKPCIAPRSNRETSARR